MNLDLFEHNILTTLKEIEQSLGYIQRKVYNDLENINTIYERELETNKLLETNLKFKPKPKRRRRKRKRVGIPFSNYVIDTSSSSEYENN